MSEILKLACSLAAACLMASAADNSLGTWKLNVAKSSYGGAPMPVKSVVMVRQATSDGVKISQTGERADGTALNMTFTTLSSSGTHRTASGSPPISATWKQRRASRPSWSGFTGSGRAASPSEKSPTN